MDRLWGGMSSPQPFHILEGDSEKNRNVFVYVGGRISLRHRNKRDIKIKAVDYFPMYQLWQCRWRLGSSQFHVRGWSLYCLLILTRIIERIQRWGQRNWRIKELRWSLLPGKGIHSVGKCGLLKTESITALWYLVLWEYFKEGRTIHELRWW